MSKIEEIKAKCENVITAGLLDGDPYDDVKEYIEALESALAESRKELFNMSYVKALAAESTAELEKYRAAERGGRLVVLPCQIGTPIFRIYNTRGCSNCTKKDTRCNGNECPRPKFYEKKFSYEHLAIIEDIKLTREAAEQALNEQEEREPQ